MLMATLRPGRGKTSLVSHNQTGDGSSRQSSHNAGDEGRWRNAGDVTTTRGSKLAQNTNLNTHRANVAEAADGICSNESRSRANIGQGFEGEEAVELVLNHQMFSTCIFKMDFVRTKEQEYSR